MTPDNAPPASLPGHPLGESGGVPLYDPSSSAFIPPPHSPEELALIRFGEVKDALVFGAGHRAAGYVRAQRSLDPLLRDPSDPYHSAAASLWDEIRHKAEENVRALLEKHGALPEDDTASIENLLGIAELREWPEVATAVLLQGWEAGTPLALLQAGNIDQNTDFLALHLRELLLTPDLRASALGFMIALSLGASGPGHDRLCDSPTQRHLAAALATGEVHRDEIEEALRRMTRKGKVALASAPELLERLLHAARRYAELVRNAQGKGFFSAWAERLDPKERDADAFLETDDEAFVRSRAREFLRDPEAMNAACRKLARIAYVEEGRSLEERHRAEERLMLLSAVSGERLLSDPERTLADWLNPTTLFGIERDMILTLVAMEDLRSGGAAARILRGALQNPLLRDEALGLMVETIFRNPPGTMEEQLLEAVSNGEVGPKENALAEVREAADDVLGPTMADWFMARLNERLETFTPGAGLLPFDLIRSEERRPLPFLASTLENRVQRSLDLLRRLEVAAPFGLREAALHLFGEAETEAVLPRYRAVLDPETLLERLRTGTAAEKEVVHQLACDLVVLNEVIQRMDRARREHLREQFPALLMLRLLGLNPELIGHLRPGTQVPRPDLLERTLELFRMKWVLVKRDDAYRGTLGTSASRFIRDWATVLMIKALRTDSIPPLPGLLNDTHKEVRDAALGLVREEPGFLPALRAMLRNRDPQVCVGAMRALEGATDPEIRWEIAQRLEDGGDVADAAARTLGGLEEMLLTEDDPRMQAAAGKALLKVDPGTLKLDLLRKIVQRPPRIRVWTSIERKRFQWAALALSRSRDLEGLRASYEAAQVSAPMEEDLRRRILRQAAMAAVQLLFRTEGAEATADRIVPPKETRIPAVMGVADRFFAYCSDTSPSENPYPGTLTPHNSTTGGIFDYRTFDAASTVPGNPQKENPGARDAIRRLYLKTIDLAPRINDWERAILASMAFITGQSMEYVMKLCSSLPWITESPFERTVFTTLFLPVLLSPDGEEGFLARLFPALDEEKG